MATLVGVGVGFSLAMWWDRRQERVARRKRFLNTIRSIRSEIETIEDTIIVPEFEAATSSDRDGSVEVEFTIPFLSRSAFDSAVYSGNLTLLPHDLQANLSSFYEQLRIARLLVDKIISLQSGGFDVQGQVTAYQNNFQHLCEHCQMIKGRIKPLYASLDKEEKRSS